MTLDFAQLADGMKRNNVGLHAITFQAVVEARDGKVVIQPTGQSFPLEGAAPPEAGPARRTMKVLDWNEPSRTRVEIVR